MKPVRRLLFSVTFFVLGSTVIFVINQTAQVVSLANAINPSFGKGVLWTCLAFYLAVILTPVILFIRLPRSLTPPVDVQSPEYESYLHQLASRLSGNPVCQGIAVSDRAGIEQALKSLNNHADNLIRQTASSVFLSTAVSQNGRLDALAVLIAQTRLVWNLAHIYNQRPSLRDFGKLYANIGATLFAASELENLDIQEQIEPVIKAALAGSALCLVPGVAPIATIVTHSVLDGAANAYLTLRVGIICRTYCGPTCVNRQKLRQSASIAAAGMLGSIVSRCATSVTKSILSAAGKSGETMFNAAAAGIRETGARFNRSKRKQPDQ